MASAVKIIYWLPHCSTCVKAKAFLEEQGFTVKATHDIKADRLPRGTVEALAKAVGGPEKLFSKRAMKYRAMGLHEREVSEAEMLDLMEEEYTFIKRPVVLFEDGTTLCGFSQKAYLKALEK